jgi:predicted CoA-substrate-specific enzyme activase
MNKSLGICVGAWSISFVEIEEKNDKIQIIKTEKIIHSGNPQKFLIEKLKNIDFSETKIVVTGRKFRNFVNLPNISETEATEIAFKFLIKNKLVNNLINKDLAEKYSAIVSLGAETFLIYNLDKTNNISNVFSKNKCASGTGEFFLQQIKRMDLSLDEATQLAENAEPYKVSGRCSVFCKSDCTHALNKGINKANVAAGLAKMIAEKIYELIRNKNDEKILLIGGVTKNKIVVDFVKKNYNNIEIPEEAEYFEALGAAIYSIENKEVRDKNELNNKIKQFDENKIFKEKNSSFSFQKPLKNFVDKVIFKESERRKAKNGEECILGLDVGSTTTKAVIISKETNAILASVYLYTNGNPIKAAKLCYQKLYDDLKNDLKGENNENNSDIENNISKVENNISENKNNNFGKSIKIVGIGTTGSGRQIAGLYALTNGIFNEITAHSTAAIFFDPEVETIFEIGGQDAKYTYIINKVPADYAMNEACSAGTGSFIEEAALESLNVKVTEIEKLALSAENPPNFSDQCSAFISSDIKTAQQEGISRENLIAGLTYSICLNYLNRVKGNRPVGKKVFMQGGVCYNKAIPIAMAAISETEIIVPPDPGLMGAFGVALQVKEKQNLGLLEIGNFSLPELINREIKEQKSFICQGGNEKCDLKCNINVVEIAGKKFSFGGACEKYNNINVEKSNNINQTNAENLEKYDFVQKRNRLMFGGCSNL